MFESALVLVATAAGAIAAVSGFGIGSLLTPLLALRLVGTRIAVAAVSVPHVIGTAVRLWLLRADVDRALLWRFGLTSAAGGLVGALLHEVASSRALAAIFGALLVFAGASEVSGYALRWRFQGWVAWAAGAASGLLGGLVGNQGGIRSAAMLGFDVKKERFVATATATALFVDAARVPIYAVAERREVAAIWPLVLLATVGTLAGTLGGQWMLPRVPEHRFRKVVGTIILFLGIGTLIRGRAD